MADDKKIEVEIAAREDDPDRGVVDRFRKSLIGKSFKWTGGLIDFATGGTISSVVDGAGDAWNAHTDQITAQQAADTAIAQLQHDRDVFLAQLTKQGVPPAQHAKMLEEHGYDENGIIARATLAGENTRDVLAAKRDAEERAEDYGDKGSWMLPLGVAVGGTALFSNLFGGGVLGTSMGFLLSAGIAAYVAYEGYGGKAGEFIANKVNENKLEKAKELAQQRAIELEGTFKRDFEGEKPAPAAGTHEIKTDKGITASIVVGADGAVDTKASKIVTADGKTVEGIPADLVTAFGELSAARGALASLPQDPTKAAEVKATADRETQEFSAAVQAVVAAPATPAVAPEAAQGAGR